MSIRNNLRALSAASLALLAVGGTSVGASSNVMAKEPSRPTRGVKPEKTMTPAELTVEIRKLTEAEFKRCEELSQMANSNRKAYQVEWSKYFEGTQDVATSKCLNLLWNNGKEAGIPVVFDHEVEVPTEVGGGSYVDIQFGYIKAGKHTAPLAELHGSIAIRELGKHTTFQVGAAVGTSLSASNTITEREDGDCGCYNTKTDFVMTQAHYAALEAAVKHQRGPISFDLFARLGIVYTKEKNTMSGQAGDESFHMQGSAKRFGPYAGIGARAAIRLDEDNTHLIIQGTMNQMFEQPEDYKDVKGADRFGTVTAGIQVDPEVLVRKLFGTPDRSRPLEPTR